jgi:hypothetical protein
VQLEVRAARGERVQASSSAKEGRFSGFFADVGAMAMGATTYEWVLGYENLIEEPGRWQQYYGSVPCWVFTHRHLPVIPGAELFFARGDIWPVHEQIPSAADGRNIWLGLTITPHVNQMRMQRRGPQMP